MQPSLVINVFFLKSKSSFNTPFEQDIYLWFLSGPLSRSLNTIAPKWQITVLMNIWSHTQKKVYYMGSAHVWDFLVETSRFKINTETDLISQRLPIGLIYMWFKGIAVLVTSTFYNQHVHTILQYARVRKA